MTCEEGYLIPEIKKSMFRNFFIFSLLASSAMGISLVDAVVSGDGSTALSWADPAGEVTVVVTLNVDQLKEYMLAGKTPGVHTLINLYSADREGCFFSLCSSGNTNTNTDEIDKSGFYALLTLPVGENQYSVGLGNDVGLGFETESFWDNAAMAAVTFSYSATKYGVTATFTLLDASGEIQQKIPGTWSDPEIANGLTFSFGSVDFAREDVTSAYVFTKELTQKETLLLAQEAGRTELGLAVPEPTTATLSLLALAALAARRRRASR